MLFKIEKMVNFSENFDVKFLKKSESCPRAQQNRLLKPKKLVNKSIAVSLWKRKCKIDLHHL